MTVLDTLFLALGVDTKGIDKGMAEAQQKIDAGARSLANSLMSPFKAALGALAAGLSLGAVTKQYLQQADAIGKMADSIGVDIEELQAWGEAAARAGGSAEAFQQTVRGMTTRITEAAKGEGEAAKIFQRFGISVKDASGKARDTFDVLRDIAGAMEGMDKQQAVGLAQKMGVDRGTIMLLQSGRAAVDDLVARQKEFGVYTKEDAEIAAKANDAIADLGQTLKAAAAIVMRAIVPAITWVTEHLTALVQDFRKHKTFYLAALGAIAAFLTAKMIPTLVKVGLLNARIWAPYAILAALVAGIAVIFDDLWVYMHGGKSALEDYWATLGTGPELLEKFNKAWESVKNVGQSALDTLQNIARSVFDFFIRNIDDFILAFEGLWDIIDGLFNFDFQKIGRGLAKAFTGAWNIIQDVFKDIFSGMEKMSIWDAIANGAKLAWDAVKALATGFFEGLPPEAQKYLTELWEKFKNFVKWDELAEKFHWDDIKTNALAAIDGIWQALNGLFNFDFKQLGEGLGKAFNSAYNLIKTLFKDIFGWFDDIGVSGENAWDMVVNVAKRAWDSLSGFAESFYNQLDPELQTLIKNVTALAGAWAIAKTIDGIISIGKEVKGLGTIITGVFNIIKAHPFGMLIAAIAVIIANWDKIEAKIRVFFAWLDQKMAAFRKWVDNVAQGEETRQKKEIAAVTNSSDWSNPDIYSYLTPPPAPAPADAVPSQVAAGTVNNTENNVTNNDNRNITIELNAALQDLANFQKQANQMFKDPPTYWGKQSASGLNLGGQS